MKLRKLLNHVDEYTDIQIKLLRAGREENLYTGSILRVPWFYGEMKLDSSCGRAIAVKIEESEDIKKVYLTVFVKEDEEWG